MQLVNMFNHVGNKHALVCFCVLRNFLFSFLSHVYMFPMM